MSESGSGCAGDGPPPLLVTIPILMRTCAYACFAVLFLMCGNYVQPLAKAAARTKSEAASSTFEADVCCSKRTCSAYFWRWTRFLVCPWLEAEFEGDAL